MLRLTAMVGIAIAGALATGPAALAAPSIDDSGFVGSAARCAAGQQAAAVGRTQRSEVVVCRTGDGDYEYIGVRVSDGASTRAPARSTDTGFVAQTETASYTVSPTRLEVFSGDRLIYGDTWIDYQEPG